MPFKLKKLLLPAFFPDATYGTLHSVPLNLVPSTNQGFVITTLYLHQLKLTQTKIQKFIPFLKDKILLSDSGGFQVLSLIHNKGLGKITEHGANFKIEGENITLTPETSQQIQHKVNSDIRVVLDYPTMGTETYEANLHSLEITTRWAKRAKKEFLKLLNITESQFMKSSPTIKQDPSGTKYIELRRPLLFAVVQGGNYPELRKKSATELLQIGFDGYGFGGWPLTKDGAFNTQIVEVFSNSLPQDKIKYGMGIGTPDDIAVSIKLGLTLFDCVIPTRNARHGLIYVNKTKGEPSGKHFDVLHIKSLRYNNDLQPLDSECKCPVCQNYTRSYIRFLLKRKNPVGYTLASLHNLWWYQTFIDSYKNA